MNKVKILFTFLGTLVISVSSFAQFEEIKAGTTIDYNNVTMQKSPSAAAFGKVQEVSVNTATGVPNISIPLYTFEMDGVSVPISISYNATGIKVGELATSVGLGWSLEAGGQFTRTVRAQADEFDGILNWGSGIGPLSDDWYASYGTTMDIEEWQKDMRGNPFSQVDDGLARNADHYPDQFGYSFLGNSGSFIYNPNAAGIIKDKTDGIKIIWDEGVGDDFEAKDMYGNFYQFFNSDTEKSNNMYTFGTEHDIVAGQAIVWEDDDGNTPPTAWKLSKITTKNNKIINFSYHSVDIDPYVIERADSHITIGYACDSGPPAPPLVKNYGYTNITYNFNTQLIDTISSPNGNIIITFEYDTDTNITTPGVWLTKLEKIVVSDFTDNSKTKIKEFHFLYDRFTGGDPRLRLYELYEVVYDEYNNSIQKPSYKFSYNNGTLPPKDSFSQDFFGYFNNNYSGGDKKTLVPLTEVGDFNSYFNARATDRNLNLSTVANGMLTGIQYPTGGSVLFEFEPNVIDTKYCGGLRIHKIENIDETGTYNKRTYEYSGLNGSSLNNRDLTYKIEGNTTSYYASFVAAAPEYKPGYFYDKVTVTSTDTKNSKSYREEHYYEENFDLQHKMDYALKQKKFFIENQSNPIKIEDYVNGIEENQFTVEWNILGDMKCYSPDVVQTPFKLGYNEYPRKLLHYGNSALLPKLIASTEYLGPSRKPVTTIKKIEYDPDTLLKTKEITDTRDTRIGFNDYGNRDESGEVLTTTYKYPSPADGFPVDFPKGLLIKKEVSSNKSEETMIFGQAMEYDNVGNVIKTFQYNKGEVGNNSSLPYVDDYEEMSTILYENGKPVQVFRKSGEATTYIWGLNNQYPVAKIEGKTRAGISQSKLQAVENASYTDLPTKLGELRGDASVQGAMLTTYTYKPLAGVETITDPKGDKITYHYDEFGRLDYVEDKDGNILSENEYHYRPQ